MRKARAASTTMGTRVPNCERDGSGSSMVRWIFSHRQKRRAFEEARQSWDDEVLGKTDAINTSANKVFIILSKDQSTTRGSHSSKIAVTKLISCNICSAG
jgi:hypothetical protein